MFRPRTFNALRNYFIFQVYRFILLTLFKFDNFQDVEALGVSFTGLSPSKIWQLIDSEAILGITPEAVEAMTSKQLEVIPDAVMKKIPKGLERKNRLR